MEIDVLNALETQTAYIPGGHDRDDRLLIVLPVPYNDEIQQNQPTAFKKQLEICINYLINSLSADTKKNGIVVVVDAQKCTWRQARVHIRLVTPLIEKHLDHLIVIRPDAFWDKQRMESCAKGHKKGEPTVISKSRLIKFFDISELPEELGGTYVYSHHQWIQNRIRYEEFEKFIENTNFDLENLHFTFLDYKLNTITESKKIPDHLFLKKDEMMQRIHAVIENGKKMIKDISESKSKTQQLSNDLLDAIDLSQKQMTNISTKQKQLHLAWTDLEKSEEDARELALLENGVTFVTNWILTTAETMLNQQNRVGFDVTTAEELRNNHEKLELQCWETYGFYAKLLYKIDKFSMPNNAHLTKNLLSQRDFMDFVCRSFAARLERRRNILITSLRFFRLVSEYFDKTNDVFKSLVMGTKVDDVDVANDNLKKLRDNQNYLDKIEKELIKEGEKLSDMLSMPVKDALGREIESDFSDDIANVRDILDATIARRNIFVDSIELQKLTLEQITHIHMYEMDAETTIKWIEDLYNVMTTNHTHVGSNVYEIQRQKDELQAFQDTAKGTFDYCCSILSAAMALRQLCKLSGDKNSEMSTKINEIFKNLQYVNQEQMTRLRVSAVFHRSVEEQCTKLVNLKNAIANICENDDDDRRRNDLRNCLGYREKLLVEIGRMVRLGRLLKTRLKEAIIIGHDKDGNEMNSDSSKNIVPSSSNSVACDAITEKLNSVSKLAEELDCVLKQTQNEILDESNDEINPCYNDKKSDELTTVEDWNSCLKSSKSSTEDESFITASELTYTPQSRSSSFHTASECRTVSPWWENDRNSFDTDSLDLDQQDITPNNLFSEIISATKIKYDIDSEHSSLSIEKSPVVTTTTSDSTDLDDNKKSSTDNLSSDSLQSKERQNELVNTKNTNNTINHNSGGQLGGEEVTNNKVSGVMSASQIALPSSISSSQHENNKNDVWNTYYQNLIAKHSIIQGFF